MDIKAKVEEIVKKVTSDKALQAKFQKDPAGAVKQLIGVDIPTDQIEQIVAAVKVKIGSDKLGGVIGNLLKK